MILSSHREWLDVVSGLPESELPCNVSTVAFAIEVARSAVAAHDGLLVAVEQLATTTPTETD